LRNIKKKKYIKDVVLKHGANSQQRQDSNGSTIRKMFKKVMLTIVTEIACTLT